LIIFFKGGLESEIFTLGTAPGRRETWLGAVKRCVGSYVPFLANPFDDSTRSSGTVTDSSPGSPVVQGTKFSSQMHSEFLPKTELNDAAENAAITALERKLYGGRKNNNVFEKCIKCNYSSSIGLIESDNNLTSQVGTNKNRKTSFFNLNTSPRSPSIGSIGKTGSEKSTEKNGKLSFSKQSTGAADSNNDSQGGDTENGWDIAETEIATERRDMDEKKIAQEIYDKFLNTTNTSQNLTDVTTLYPYLLPYIRAFWRPVEEGETSADKAFPAYWTLVEVVDEDASDKKPTPVRSELGKKEKTSTIALVCDLGKFEMMQMQDRTTTMTLKGSSSEKAKLKGQASSGYFSASKSKEVKKVFDSSSRRAAELKEFVDVVVDEINEILSSEEQKHKQRPVGLQYPTLHTILDLDGLNLQNLDHSSTVNPRITKAQDLSSALLDIIVALKRVIPLTGGLIADPLDPKFASDSWQAARIVARLDAGLTKVKAWADSSAHYSSVEKNSPPIRGPGIIMYPKIRGMDFGYYGGTNEKTEKTHETKMTAMTKLGLALEIEDAKGPQLPQREGTRAINFSAKILSPSTRQRRVDNKLRALDNKLQTQKRKILYIHSVFNFEEAKEMHAKHFLAALAESVEIYGVPVCGPGLSLKI